MKTERAFSINCLLCRSNAVKMIPTHWQEFQMAQCRSCGFWFILPRPSQETLKNVYQDFTNQTESCKLSAKKAKKNVGFWQKWLKKYSPSAKRILEIGCSSGHLLYGFKQWGYEVFGCDLSAKAANLGRRDYGLDVFVGQLPPENLQAGFDVLVLSHLVEHLLSPKDFLRQALQFLKPQGIALLATPNLNSLGFRLFGSRYPMVSPPLHLNFFNKKTLHLLLADKCSLLKFQTTSYDSMGRNSFFYNFFVSLLGMFKKPKDISSAEQSVKITEPAPKVLETRKLARQIIQFALFPFFWLFDKLGLGDNIVALARKK